MSWIIEEKSFIRENIELNGNKFLLGNGYMGYRGTLEEYEKKQLVACNLLGLYDKVGAMWREPVNAPNGFYTTLRCDDELLDNRSNKTEEHIQSLDIQSGSHKRKSTFITPTGNRVYLETERFLGLANVHLMCMKYTFRASEKCKIVIETGIDGDVWDINGPHLKNVKPESKGDIIVLNSSSSELGCMVSVAECIGIDFKSNEEIFIDIKRLIRKITLEAHPDEVYTFYKYVTVYTGNDGVINASRSSVDDCMVAKNRGYEDLLAENIEQWSKRWKISDVKISGDDNAQLALRYSI